jgi:hypothetical protein
MVCVATSTVVYAIVVVGIDGVAVVVVLVVMAVVAVIVVVVVVAALDVDGCDSVTLRVGEHNVRVEVLVVAVVLPCCLLLPSLLSVSLLLSL